MPELCGKEGGGVKKTLVVMKEIVYLYTNTRIPRAAAALSYYLTMTVFPLIICLYSLLGNSYYKAIKILTFFDEFLSAETIDYVKAFLNYVAASHSTAMLVAGLTVLATSASAAVRTLQTTIGEMQGGKRFQGLMDFLFSLIVSLAFLAAMYFSILVMLTGRDFLEWINGFLPFVDISSSWRWVRFLLMGAIEYVIFGGIYEISKRRSDRYRVFPGAVFATLAMVVMTLIFSAFISASARYPLVYGSLASLILLMFWLYLCCQIIYVGAALNVALRDVLSPRQRGRFRPEPDGREDEE